MGSQDKDQIQIKIKEGRLFQSYGDGISIAENYTLQVKVPP